MTDNMVEITVKVLDILAIATKEIKQSRASELIVRFMSLEADMMRLERFLKKVARVASLENGLVKLDQLTNAGARMASVEISWHDVNKKVIDIGDYAKIIDEKVLSVEDKVQLLNDNTINAIDDKVQVVIDGTQGFLATTSSFTNFYHQGGKEARVAAVETKLIIQQAMDDIDVMKRSYLVFVFADDRVSDATVGSQIRQLLRAWQCPPDPSTNHNVARKMEHEGTEVWFFEDDKFKEWKVTGSLLWIYGKRKFILPSRRR